MNEEVKQGGAKPEMLLVPRRGAPSAHIRTPQKRPGNGEPPDGAATPDYLSQLERVVARLEDWARELDAAHQDLLLSIAELKQKKTKGT